MSGSGLSQARAISVSAGRVSGRLSEPGPSQRGRAMSRVFWVQREVSLHPVA